MYMKTNIFKCIVSATFLILGIISLFSNYIKLNINTLTIVLFVLAFVPWILNSLEEFEINGIGKFKIKEKDKEIINNNMEKINVTNKKDFVSNYTKYDDPKIVLAALRIDIEDLLNQIALKNNLQNKKYGIKTLSKELYSNGLIENFEYSLILDVVVILNKAIHSQLNDYDISSYNWVLNTGAKLIESLKYKLDN